MSNAIRAVLFDLDGTLVDNMSFHIEAWIETGRLFGRELTPEHIQREFSGRKNEELLPQVAGRPLEAAEIARLAEQKEARYRELYTPHMRLHGGVAELLDELAARGVAVGIASAAPRKNRELVLNGLGLASRIATVVGAEEVARGKPAPDLFLEAARRLGCDPRATLVFEDAVLGVQAGRAAGMSVCGVTTSEPGEILLDAGAEHTIADFTTLPSELRFRLGLDRAERVYKICSHAEWQAALAAGRYVGSADDARDGFIHFSLAHQLAGTAAKYFAGRSDLVLVAVDARRLGTSLRLEASRGGELFPHLYATLQIDCVVWAAALPWHGDAHVWPTDVAD